MKNLHPLLKPELFNLRLKYFGFRFSLGIVLLETIYKVKIFFFNLWSLNLSFKKNIYAKISNFLYLFFSTPNGKIGKDKRI